MMQTVTLDEAKQRLDELIDAAINGDTILIVRPERPTV